MVWLDEGGRGRGYARLIMPPRKLARWVEHFWIQIEPVCAPERPWRIVADACGHLIFSIESGGGRQRIRCSVVGARPGYEDIDITGRSLTVGVRLRLGALTQLAPSKAVALTGRALKVEDAFGSAGRALTDRMSPDSPDSAVHHLGLFLEERLSSRQPDVEMQQALQSVRSVVSLSRSLNISLRALYTRTMETVGLSPRRLLRIMRLHRALQYAATPGRRWAEIAYLAGFADQAHMVREFRSLLGDTPNAWRGRSTADSFNTSAQPSR